MRSEYILLFLILLPAVSALLSFFIGRKSEILRNRFNILIHLIIFLIVCALYPLKGIFYMHLFIPDLMGTGLYLKLDSFRYIFIFLTSLIWLLSTIFSTQYLLGYKNRNRYYVFFMLTYSATLGIFLSNHLLNLFTFFELMTITSYFLIIHDEDQFTLKAGYIYISMAIGAGLIQLMGIFILFTYSHTLYMEDLFTIVPALGSIKYTIAVLIMIGFAVKACMFPLHIWLPMVYPPAPAPVTAILSAVLTKTGIFGIILISKMLDFDLLFSSILLTIGLINMFWGGLLAIFHRNIKKILAYSSMSQLGYIILAIGLIGFSKETPELAFSGALYHIINHALFKTLLFLIGGIIFMNLKKLSLNEIRGFGKARTSLKLLFMIGLLGMVGFPGFSGYISKTLIHHAILEPTNSGYAKFLKYIEYLYILSSAFTVAYLLKIFDFVFVMKNDHAGFAHEKLHARALYTMVIPAIGIIILGFFPKPILNLIAFSTINIFKQPPDLLHLHFFNMDNLIGSAIILGIGLFLYFVLVKKLLIIKKEAAYFHINPSENWITLEKNIYRPIFSTAFTLLSFLLIKIDHCLLDLFLFIKNTISKIMAIEFNPDLSLHHKLMLIYKATHKNNAIDLNLISDAQVKTNILKDISIADIKLNSLTYSIFTFGILLAILFLTMIISFL